MSSLLISHQFRLSYGRDLAAFVARENIELDLLVLPPERDDRLPEDACARADIAFFSGDVFPEFSRQFFSAVRKAPKLKWLHVFNVGVDHPVYAEMLARGVRLTTSSGSTAQPIAQTAVAGLLMLARGFPYWLEAQRRRAWEPMRPPAVSRDLPGQRALIVGLGHIGGEIARLCRALGLHVIGIRRRPRAPGDPVDELHSPSELRRLLRQADWLVIACPLTAETRGLIDANALAALPEGARVINIARGEIVDEPALIAALRSGRLGGAYLDVFAEEPLPAGSPLWDMPNVIISPHNSSVATGNEQRVYEIFQKNLRRWSRGEPLLNEVTDTMERR